MPATALRAIAGYRQSRCNEKNEEHYQAEAMHPSRQPATEVDALGRAFRCSSNQITQWKSQLLERAAELFASGQVRPREGPSLKELHAKIGQQALEIDFCPARSANWTGRAQNDDRARARVADRLSGAAAQVVASEHVLPDDTDLAGGLAADAQD